MKQRRDLTVFPTESLGELLTGMMRPFSLRLDEAVPSIKLDVSEGPEAYEVKADIPGVDKKDIDVRIDGNLVSISAHVSDEKQTKDGDRVLRQERHYGAVSRQFSLAHDIDQGRTVAKYENGVLSLTLPKREQSSSGRINVA